MKRFVEFVERKDRDAKKHLKIVKKLLEGKGLKVHDYLDTDDPYIFLSSNDNRLHFEGIRIYKLGDTVAFRVQKRKDTHPYGKAYPLDIEGIFNDYLSETGDEEKAGKHVIEDVIQELKKFFEKSLEAQRDLTTDDIEDRGDRVIVNKQQSHDGNFFNKVW